MTGDIDVMTWAPRYDFTDEPMPGCEAWRRDVDIDAWRHRVDLFLKIERARRNPMLALQRRGAALYRLTSGGNLKRTFQIPKATREAVLERDKRCVWCQSPGPLEIDHIVRYADGGDESLANLRALCSGCHGGRGGRGENPKHET